MGGVSGSPCLDGWGQCDADAVVAVMRPTGGTGGPPVHLLVRMLAGSTRTDGVPMCADHAHQALEDFTGEVDG